MIVLKIIIIDNILGSSWRTPIISNAVISLSNAPLSFVLLVAMVIYSSWIPVITTLVMPTFLSAQWEGLVLQW